MQNKLSTEPYKGVRDFYPEDEFVQKHIFNIMSKTAEKYGYIAYSTSILEPAELYRSKTSEEIVNEQTYTFKDRGEREVTLRPELTPSITRMIARKRRDLTLPLRLYTIGNCFRYERPQKGRLREHWQLNADLFGSSKIESEIEIISLAYSIMKEFGANDSDFEIRVSDRKILNEIYDEIGGLSDSTKITVTRLLDKKDKIDNFKEELVRNLGEDKANQFLEILDKKPSSEDLERVMSTLKERGVNNAVIDINITRGFDYYTGIVFEVFDTNSENRRSLFGGGRYDNLFEIFEEENIPAVGFGMGDVTIRDFLDTHNLLPEYKTKTDLYIGILNETLYEKAEKIAKDLRSSGINVELDLTDKKIGDQVKIADKHSVPYFIAIGEDEISSGKFKLKNLKTREEKDVEINQIAETIKSER